eukprot:m51a1_g7690 hypothetical protein (304) ;mRNA; f:50089-51271
MSATGGGAACAASASEPDLSSDEERQVSSEEYRGVPTRTHDEAEAEERAAAEEQQHIANMMGRARELLAPFNLEPSSEHAAQPCTFGDVRAGIKGLQILNAATFRELINRLNVLQQSVDSSRQARDLTLREKIMCSIPVPGLGNLPPESGPFSSALSAIMARPIVAQIEQWTKANYAPLFKDHPEWKTNAHMHFDEIIQAVWPPEFVTFFAENPTVRKGVCEHIQAVWRNQRSNESRGRASSSRAESPRATRAKRPRHSTTRTSSQAVLQAMDLMEQTGIETAAAAAAPPAAPAAAAGSHATH